MSRGLRVVATIAAGFGVARASTAADHERAPEWEDVPAILARIHAPEFPNHDFAIEKFGAVGDGKTDALPAIRRAITACHDAGGGRVVVPAGEFLVNGPIHLLSGVNLHVA